MCEWLRLYTNAMLHSLHIFTRKNFRYDPVWNALSKATAFKMGGLVICLQNEWLKPQVRTVGLVLWLCFFSSHGDTDWVWLSCLQNFCLNFYWTLVICDMSARTNSSHFSSEKLSPWFNEVSCFKYDLVKPRFNRIQSHWNLQRVPPYRTLTTTIKSNNIKNLLYAINFTSHGSWANVESSWLGTLNNL